MGAILKTGLRLHSDGENVQFYLDTLQNTMLSCKPRTIGSNAYYLEAEIVPHLKEKAMPALHIPVWTTWHERLGHPSDNVLPHFKDHTIGFSKTSLVRDNKKICIGCIEGKMTSKSFPISDTRASKAFELVHSDLKEFPTKSYHGFKYYISFIDDYTSYAWTMNLRTKDESLKALQQFLEYIKV